MEFALDHDLFWIAPARLDSWRGYRDCSGSYGEMVAGEADGSVTLVFAPEGRDIAPLQQEERALVSWFIENEPGISSAVKAAIFEAYSALTAGYGYSPEEQAQYMPPLGSAEDLRQLIGLHSVNIHPIRKNGMPYIGYEFGCAWDPEHGLGVMMHGARLVEIGGSDAALLMWIAEKDAAK